MDVMKKKWHRYHYKNLTYLFLSLIVALVLLKNEAFHGFLLHLGNLGYFGALIGGALFSSTFTVSIGAVILMILAERLNPLEVALMAGVGGVLCDLIIFHFIKNKGLVSEIKHLFEYFGSDKISHLLHTKYFSWTLPVIGGIIIASPLPDELGVGLMGLSQMKLTNFLILSFIFNFIGMFLVASAGSILKP